MNNMETTSDFQNAWASPRVEMNKKGFQTTEYKSWDEYDLSQHDVWYNGLPTGKRHIVYHDQFVNTCSKQYVLLPNEEVLEVVEEIMKEHPEYNLVPDMSQSQGQWYNQNGNLVLSKRTSSLPAGTSMLARYVIDKEFDPSGDGRPIKLGVSVGNSIDLSRGFSIMPYHFRPYCTNSMYHVSYQTMIAEGNAEFQKAKVDTYEKDIETARSNIADAENYVRQVGQHNKELVRNTRHTKRLTKNFIEEQIVRSLSSLDVIRARYEEMNNLKLTKAHAQRIVDSMPKTSLKDFDFIKTTEVTDEQGKTKVQADVVGNPTQWDGFNALTDYLSHGRLAFNSTLNHFRDVDQIFMKAVA
jgi:hypothetical protein